MNKYGIVLPSYPYNETRVKLIRGAMETLERTVHDEEKPKLLLVLKSPELYPRSYVTPELAEAFDVETVNDPINVKGTEQTLAYGTQYLFDQGVEYVTWMGDDAAFNSQWHMKLRQLIQDKPEALAWSVYRSAYEQYHTTLEEQNGYVRVSTLCGHGMTIAKKEWEVWGIDWQHGKWLSPDSDTLDLYHATCRVGERWTTAESYVEHTGRSGVHCNPSIPEWARNFVGT